MLIFCLGMDRRGRYFRLTPSSWNLTLTFCAFLGPGNVKEVYLKHFNIIKMNWGPLIKDLKSFQGERYIKGTNLCMFIHLYIL